jgi:hypothetical protein
LFKPITSLNNLNLGFPIVPLMNTADSDQQVYESPTRPSELASRIGPVLRDTFRHQSWMHRVMESSPRALFNDVVGGGISNRTYGNKRTQIRIPWRFAKRNKQHSLDREGDHY